MAVMQGALEDFLRALRAMEVRDSPAEAIDAHMAVAAVGYGDRELLKDALCVTLAKSEDEVERFDVAFDTFFTREEFKGAMGLVVCVVVLLFVWFLFVFCFFLVPSYSAP